MEWPFFLILTSAFVFVYIQSILANPLLRQPGRLVLFTVVMAVHLVLHWMIMRVRSYKRVALYLVVQSGLAFTVVYMGGSLVPLFAVYLGLIGETIGLLHQKPRWRNAAVLGMLGLSFWNYIMWVGRTGWFWWVLAMLPMTFFVVVYVTLYSRQAEARAQAQRLAADLEIANRQLSEYAARVEDLTIAAERQRMARELHDTLSQGLAGLILQLEAADAHLEGDRPERARLILEKSMEKARETLAEARLAIDDLRHAKPRSLEEAVRQEAGHFTDSTGIPCTPAIDLPADIPEPVSEAAIRLSMEGLTNIARHAHATSVTLRIGIVEGKDQAALELEICDNGAGFDPEKVEPGHYGLLGMRERVRLAGGSLELRSAPGQGTCLLARFPLRSEKLAQGVGAA